MTQNSQDDSVDKALQLLYRSQATEQPSEALDSHILAMAQASKIHAPKQVSFWRQYRWPLSSAASVLLVVSILLLNPTSQDPLLMEPAFIAPQALESQAARAPRVMSAPMAAPENGEPEIVGSTAADSNVGESTASDASANLVETSKMTATSQVSTEPASTVNDSNETTQRHKALVSTEGAPILQGKSVSSSPTILDSKADASNVKDSEPSAVAASAAETREAQPPATLKGQAKAVISDKQALNHLQQLVSTEQWSEAMVLLQRINQQRPQLADKTHPLHQKWRHLSQQIDAHSQP